MEKTEIIQRIKSSATKLVTCGRGFEIADHMADKKKAELGRRELLDCVAAEIIELAKLAIPGFGLPGLKDLDPVQFIGRA